MLTPSEVWERAYHEGRECPIRLRDTYPAAPALQALVGGYGREKPRGSPLCALGFLVEPYREDLLRVPAFEPVLAGLYGVSQAWISEAEQRYEGWMNYPRHTLLELAEWARAQGH